MRTANYGIFKADFQSLCFHSEYQMSEKENLLQILDVFH